MIYRALNFGIGAALVLIVAWVAVLHVESIADMEPQTWSVSE